MLQYVFNGSSWRSHWASSARQCRRLMRRMSVEADRARMPSSATQFSLPILPSRPADCGLARTVLDLLRGLHVSAAQGCMFQQANFKSATSRHVIP